MPTSSKIKLKLQRLIQEKGFSQKQLSEELNVSEEMLAALTETDQSIELTHENAEIIRKISIILGVSVFELIEPIKKREALKLNILELAQSQDLTLEELSERSKVDRSIISFFCFQPICKQTLSDPQTIQHLNKISEALGLNIDELRSEAVEAELPATRLRLEELSRERNLTIEDLGVLTELPVDFLNLLNTQPIELASFRNMDFVFLRVCKLLDLC